MKKHFQLLLQYEATTQARLIEALAGEVSLPEQVLTLLSHQYNALMIWLTRLSSHSPVAQPWDVHSFLELTRIHQGVFNQLNLYLASLRPEDLEMVVAYQNSRGETFQNSIEEILQHLFLHSAHHRGQIALRMRQGGLDVPVTDFIFFTREMRNLHPDDVSLN